MHGSKRSLIVMLVDIPSASADCPILLNFVGRHFAMEKREELVSCA
jgi:hypothetical protein